MTALVTLASLGLLLYAFTNWYRVARVENALRAKRILHYVTGAAVFFLGLRIGLPSVLSLCAALLVMSPALFPPRKVRAPSPEPPFHATLTLREAASILGVEQDADEAAINAAWRERMRRHHPDQGGSDHLASLINRARDMMLEHSNRRS